ncbi:MAG: terminase family protein [Bradyrhizobium sp.]|uniref:terminase large subunit domain-containing protein n=1 Tax=Bradyrhizobium sp. TaxID=376 RepID=UPI003D139D57
MTTEYVYQRPWLYPKQSEFLFHPARYVIVEASTKTGKTVGCLVWLAEQAMLGGGPGRHYWWVAPVFTQANIAFGRLQQFFPHGMYEVNRSERTITLPNGASIWFKSADNPDSLYGEDVHAAVIDEATRCKEESWHAVRSTLTATRGPVRIIGNVKGRRNWAYRLARQAEQGTPDMAYFKLIAHDAVHAGVLKAEEIADAERTLPSAIFRELYFAEPSDDSGNPFGLQAIESCLVPLSTAPPVCWGIDLAKSTDWTVCIGLDSSGVVCGFERWQGPWESTVQRIGALVGNTYALVDSTGVGDPVLEALQKSGGQYEGYKFTGPSKQQLMEGLAVAIQRHEIGYPDGEIRQELDSFEYEYTKTGVHYSAPEGLHDDCVCALALAVHGWRQRSGVTFAPTGPTRQSPWRM